jgi:type I restriction enzyme, S subunit
MGSPEDVEFIGLENIESWTGRYIAVEPAPATDSEKSAPHGTSSSFSAGDVLFGKLRPYLAKALLADRDGICSTELLVLQPSAELNAKFLFYVLLCPEFVRTVDSSTFGAKMPRANWDFIGTMPVPLPSLAEQRRIVAYLDAETAQIDALVAEKEHMLALLKEKRAALISHAVTRGINPHVPLKPSGLLWLGEIPAHWEVRRAKALFSVRDVRSENGDEELMTVSHITGVTPRAEKEVFMFKAEDMTGYKRCEAGDLVVNTLWAWMGAMGVAWQPGIVSPDYHVYVSNGKLKPAYIDALSRSKPFVAAVNRFSKGVWSSRLRLYPEAFFSVRMPVPPPEDQDAIIIAINSEREKTAELEHALKHSIIILKERRSALITAAVTGQIDVCGREE